MHTLHNKHTFIKQSVLVSEIWLNYLKECGDFLPNAWLHTGHVLKQPIQMTISRVQFLQLYQYSIELVEQLA